MVTFEEAIIKMYILKHFRNTADKLQQCKKTIRVRFQIIYYYGSICPKRYHIRIIQMKVKLGDPDSF